MAEFAISGGYAAKVYCSNIWILIRRAISLFIDLNIDNYAVSLRVGRALGDLAGGGFSNVPAANSLHAVSVQKCYGRGQKRESFSLCPIEPVEMCNF